MHTGVCTCTHAHTCAHTGYLLLRAWLHLRKSHAGRIPDCPTPTRPAPSYKKPPLLSCPLIHICKECGGAACWVARMATPLGGWGWAFGKIRASEAPSTSWSCPRLAVLRRRLRFCPAWSVVACTCADDRGLGPCPLGRRLMLLEPGRRLWGPVQAGELRGRAGELPILGSLAAGSRGARLPTGGSSGVAPETGTVATPFSAFHPASASLGQGALTLLLPELALGSGVGQTRRRLFTDAPRPLPSDAGFVSRCPETPRPGPAPEQPPAWATPGGFTAAVAPCPPPPVREPLRAVSPLPEHRGQPLRAASAWPPSAQASGRPALGSRETAVESLLADSEGCRAAPRSS